MQVYIDDNDGGKTGYGIMTNDPPFPLHLQAIADLKEQQRVRPSTVQMPGGWSSVERFNRIFLVKSQMVKPIDGEEAVMQAFHVLNSVSVPFGANFFGGYQTQWAAVWDHKRRALYWRSHL